MRQMPDDDIVVHGLQGQSRDMEEASSYLGHEEILGAYEILGAALQASSQQVKGGSAFQSALANRVARRAPIVQKVQPTKKRRYTLGFGPTTIPPLSTVTVQTQPQVLFRGEKLIDTSVVQAGLFIQGIFVGNKPQLPTFQSPIAVTTYAGGVLDNEQMFDTCDPALFITFQIQNITGATLTWSASLIGHIVQ